MRKLNDMFHIDDDGRLVKTSNNTLVPDDEPIFILRARDRLATSTLIHYFNLMKDFSLDQERALQIAKVVDTFIDFSNDHPDRMKAPGSTRGK